MLRVQTLTWPKEFSSGRNVGGPGSIRAFFREIIVKKRQKILKQPGSVAKVIENSRAHVDFLCKMSILFEIGVEELSL
jgi:hypothetical protein